MEPNNNDPHSVLVAAGLSAILASCTAVLGDKEPPGPTVRTSDHSDSPLGNDATVDSPFVDSEAEASPLRMRRLTRVEYNNTVRDLLGDTTQPANAFVVDDSGEIVLNNIASSVNTLMAERYRSAAETLAFTAIQAPENLAPCASSEPLDEAMCATAFITDFGRRAFRRPLAEEEVSGLRDVFNNVYADIGQPADFATRLRVTLTTILQSPSFLYRPDTGVPTGDDPDTVRLTDFEIASRLSYTLWASAPDVELLDAAAAGDLATPTGIMRSAERMLASPHFADGLKNFHMQWLGLVGLPELTKDTAIFPEFTDEFRADLEESLATFVTGIFVEGDARLPTLLAHPTDDTGQRAGLLTHPAFLAVHATPTSSSPIKRGVAVRDRILCQQIPEPPDGIPQLPERILGQTTRERFATHTADPTCASCHDLIDPIGFGLENYDSLGRYRDTEDGIPIDNLGSLVDAGDVAGDFSGGVELAALVSQSDLVAECFADVWLQFALGAPPDDIALHAIVSEFGDADWDVRELLFGIVTSDAFRYGRREN